MDDKPDCCLLLQTTVFVPVLVLGLERNPNPRPHDAHGLLSWKFFQRPTVLPFALGLRGSFMLLHLAAKLLSSFQFLAPQALNPKLQTRSRKAESPELQSVNARKTGLDISNLGI